MVHCVPVSYKILLISVLSSPTALEERRGGGEGKGGGGERGREGEGGGRGERGAGGEGDLFPKLRMRWW